MQDATCMRFSHHLVKQKNYKYPRQLDGDSMYGDAGESLLYKLIKLFILFFFFSNIILLIFDAGVRPSLSWVWVSCDLNNKYKYRVLSTRSKEERRNLITLSIHSSINMLLTIFEWYNLGEIGLVIKIRLVLSDWTLWSNFPVHTVNPHQYSFVSVWNSGFSNFLKLVQDYAPKPTGVLSETKTAKSDTFTSAEMNKNIPKDEVQGAKSWD